ncbi:TlpA family protein disulfide reductase [Lysobacter terrestris]|uniref:TlpA family protein disulfide reductase n=2 Tax=Agrilutibacter terrestris TaxID=2865112 RepID=A0A7H0G177_9GAMM|nr:TlpA family protein disulfide reductase [Lysobacter terrestris]
MLARLAGLLLLVVLVPASAADGAVQPRPGDTPPDALGSDLKGNPVTVSGHKGKVVIVTFWASWCGPCRRELPILGKLQKAVGRDHLEVIAINYKEDRREFRDVIRANKDIALTYVHDAKGAISDRYGVTSLPNMFIVDREGRVAHVHRGYSPEMLDGFVKEMLALLPAEVLQQPAGG